MIPRKEKVGNDDRIRTPKTYYADQGTNTEPAITVTNTSYDMMYDRRRDSDDRSVYEESFIKQETYPQRLLTSVHPPLRCNESYEYTTRRKPTTSKVFESDTCGKCNSYDTYDEDEDYLADNDDEEEADDNDSDKIKNKCKSKGGSSVTSTWSTTITSKRVTVVGN